MYPLPLLHGVMAITAVSLLRDADSRRNSRDTTVDFAPVLCRITLSSVPKMLYLCRRFALLLVAAFGLPLAGSAAVAGTVSRFLPVARSRYALRRCVAQGAGGGGGQEEGAGGGGEKKASLIDRCGGSAECACCLFCVE